MKDDNSKEIKEDEYSNILAKVLTTGVSKFDKSNDVNLGQSANIFSIV